MKKIYKLKKENQKLKMAIVEFAIKYKINKELYENLSKETLGVIKSLIKENVGEINLNLYIQIS